MTGSPPATPAPATPVALAERNVVIDAARAASVVVVIVFHMALFRAVITPDGGLRASVAEPGVPGAVASWFVQVMPLFFVTGGFAHGVVLERGRARGESYARFLAQRLRRFLGPLTTFVALLGALATAAAWAGRAREAVFVSSSLTKVLWFLVAYLMVVLLAPLMDRLQGRAPVATFAGLFTAAVAVDVASFAATDPVAGLSIRHANVLFVWLFCHQLGLAYHRGWWRTWPRWAAVASVVVGVGAIVVLVGPGPYPYPAVGFGDRTVSNLLPPTVAMALLAVAQVGILALVDGRRWPVLRTPAATRAMSAANALLMTVYLWHVPAVSIAMGVWALVSRATGVSAWWLTAGFQLAVGLPLLALWVPRIARLDLRMVPGLGPRPTLPSTLVGSLVLLAGVALLWRNGLAAHPASPYAALGLVMVTIASLLVQHGCDARHAAPPRGHSGQIPTRRAEESP